MQHYKNGTIYFDELKQIGDNPVTKGTTLFGDPNAYISVVMAGDGDTLNCVWNTIPDAYINSRNKNERTIHK